MVSRPSVLAVGLSACCWAAVSAAHDFWLQPKDYRTIPNGVTFITLQVGHGPFRQRSPIPARRITKFEVVGPTGVTVDLHGGLRVGGESEDAEFRLETPGTHIVVLQTDDRAQTHLPAIRFNDYLQVEGLTPALEQRARLHRAAADGSERYSRNAKALVQVGPSRAGSSDQVIKPVGLPLEIVPEVSPYAMPRPATMPVRVMYQGHILASALVKLTDLNDDASPREVRLTDRNGRATFTMPGAGNWLLNVIWTKPLPRTDSVDFETTFSSLSFGLSNESAAIQ